MKTLNTKRRRRRRRCRRRKRKKELGRCRSSKKVSSLKRKIQITDVFTYIHHDAHDVDESSY